MIVPIPYVHLAMGLVSSLLSIPLILRKVPMNRAYGFRLKKAFVSENNWYALNRHADAFELHGTSATVPV